MLRINHTIPLHIEKQNNLLKLVLQELSDLLVKKEKQYNSSIQSFDLTDFEIDDVEIHSQMFEEEEDLLHNLKHTFYSSLLLTTYSNLEFNLSLIISEIESCSESKIKMKDLKREGSSIKNSLRYLSLVHDIGLVEENSLISYIEKVSQVRNCIAHLKGVIPTNNDNKRMRNSISAFVLKENGIHITEESIIISDKEFIETFLKNSQKFLLSLVIKINNN